MTQNLIRNLSAHSQYQEAREIIKPSVTDKQTILKSKTQSSQKDILSVCNDPCVLAQQLTHIEMVGECITEKQQWKSLKERLQYRNNTLVTMNQLTSREGVFATTLLLQFSPPESLPLCWIIIYLHCTNMGR